MAAEKTQDAKFDEVDDASRIAKFFGVISQKDFPLTFWFKNQALKFDTRINHHVQGQPTFTVRLPYGLEHYTLEKTLTDQGSEEIMGSFRADNLNYFFKTVISNRAAAGYLTIEVPKKLFRLQRRANVRIPFARAEAPIVTFRIKDDAANERTGFTVLPEQYRIIDLSAGGMAIAAGAEKKEQLKKGVELNHLSFKVRGDEIACEGVVLHAEEIANERGKMILKVGIQFHKLPLKNEKMLLKFALDESRKLFSQLYS